VHDTARKLLHIGGAAGGGNCGVALLRQVHGRADALQPSVFVILGDECETCRVRGDDICATGELEHGGPCLGWLCMDTHRALLVCGCGADQRRPNRYSDKTGDAPRHDPLSNAKL